MQWFINFRTGQKIAVLAVILIVFMLFIGGVGYYAGQTMADKAEEMYNDRLLPVKWLNTMRNNFRAIEADCWQIVIAPIDQTRQKQVLDDIERRTNDDKELLGQYSKTKLDPFEVEVVAKLNKELEIHRAERKIALDLALAGKKQEAFIHFNEKALPSLNKLNAHIRDLAEYNAKVAADLEKQTKEMASFVNKMTIGITILAISLAIITTWYISRIIVEPLKEMLSCIAKDENGYITIKKVNVRSSDEVGELGTVLNEFTEQVRKVIEGVANSAEQLAASSEELTASAEQSAQATNQVAVSISEVAQGTEEQAKAVGETSTVLEHISENIRQVAANADVMTGTSEKAAAAAQHGGKSVKTAVEQMDNIERTVSGTAQVVSKLGERSKEIGQIVDTISGIASQTNLLALNAAIEAARAGEQGRGFAVVAEEVRKLAEQSQEAAKKIAVLIGEIQVETDRAVTAMEDGTREVKTGAEVVNAAGETFTEIVNLVSQLSGQVRDITAAIQQVAAGSQQIVTSVKAVDRLSREMAGQTQNVSAATEEQSASMQEIASSSQSLAKMAQELQDTINSFKV